MTITTSAPQSDVLAGYCDACQNGQHSMCSRGRCACPAKIHASPAVDASLCGYCRARKHRACTRADCGCTQGLHPKRATPGRDASPLADVRDRARASAPPAPAPTTSAPAAKTAAAKVEPVWELVKAAPAAPPPKPRKPTPAELVKPMLDTIVEAGDRDSWRVALFGTSIAAGHARKALAKAFPEQWAWTSGRDDEGRPAVFVRWLGPATGGDE